MFKEHQSKAGITGLVIASVFDMRAKYAQKIEGEIEEHIKRKPVLDLPLIIDESKKRMILAAYHAKRQKHYQIFKEMVAELARLFKVREYQVVNLIVTVGRAVIADRLANDTTYTGIINYGALGTDDTGPVAANTTLGTEVFRKVTASTSTTDHQAFIDFFYSKSDTNGTYKEFGTFIDGAAGADTGQLWTRALTGDWVKSSSESMTVAAQYDINYQA